MKHPLLRAACLAWILAWGNGVRADQARAVRLTFSTFIEGVLRQNPDRAAQLTREKGSEAAIEAARKFPDPSLALAADSVAIAQRDAPFAFSIGIEEEFELGGKRGARIGSAQADHRRTMAESGSFTADLVKEAAEAWVEALAAHQQLARKDQALASLERVNGINRERVRAGDIGEIEVAQSGIEVERFRGEIAKARAAVRDADLRLLALAGMNDSESDRVVLEGSLTIEAQAATADELLKAARAHNVALKSAQAAVAAADKRLELVRADRRPNLTIGVGWLHNTAGRGGFEIPELDALRIFTSIPLPFSMLNQGPVEQARAEQLYARRVVEAAERALDSKVRRAVEQYNAATKRLALFNGPIVQSAEKVRNAKLYSYQRGEVSLLEELHAEQTLNEVYLEQIEALQDHAEALIEIQYLTGLPERLPL
jgi:cobalt-zinc-cadmium efflux system outer membrane protein